MDLATFKAAFPEFVNPNSDDHIVSALARAATYINADVWGELAEEALGLKAAVLLAASAFAFRTRPKGAPQSAYAQRFAELAEAIPRRGLVLHGQ